MIFVKKFDNSTINRRGAKHSPNWQIEQLAHWHIIELAHYQVNSPSKKFNPSLLRF